MDHGLGISISTSSSSISTTSASATSTASSGSLLERRNRRRSSAISGPHPAEVPLTESDQILANTIARINLQNSREAPLKPQVPRQSLRPLVVPHLDLTFDSAKDIDEPSSSAEKTPTQATWRLLSAGRTECAVLRSHSSDGSQSTTTFHLYPIPDTSDQKTPTQRSPGLSPIQAKLKASSNSPLARGQHQLSPDWTLGRGDERSPVLPREVQLSPYRSLTRRTYTNSPLSSDSSRPEGENTGKVSPQGKVETRDASSPHTPLESFPSFEDN